MAVLCAWPGRLQAQQIQYTEQSLRVRRAVQAPLAEPLRRPAAPRYDVVALRVEFQPDTTRFTTGDGTFGGVLFDDGLQPRVDPLPHDAAYFDAHLAFLEDYVAQVSDGQTQVTTHLIPEVIRVSQPMAAYSPTGFEADSDEEVSKLLALVGEAWALASQQSSFDPSGLDPTRTAFVLFHAGVGRDVELLGTILDKTPQDLPSLFLGEDTLQRFLGSVAYKGLPLTNTLLIPRTETRQGFNFIDDVPVLLELSINGLLAASFFNFMGVPDLFNTVTGESAIGPFGLMDPLGFFSFNGLFAPEPSAWTKHFLGWVTPLDLIGEGPQPVALQAAGLDGSTVVRAHLSSAEYFLVENRHRKPRGEDLILQVWQDGQVVEQRFQNGQADFNRFDISGFAGGVVVGANTYDWALPGGLDEDGNELNGGILIWHIDERRLAEGLSANGVNTDPERRAVDLEEADSAQDLGFPSDNPFGPVADQGTPFDFYYEGNPVVVITATNQQLRLYENRFGPTTIPNSDTNEGGSSLIVLEDFSVPGPEMTFTYRLDLAEATVRPRLSMELTGRFGQGASLVGNDEEVIFVAEGASEQGAGDVFAVGANSGFVRAIVPDALARPVLAFNRLFALTRSEDGGLNLTYAAVDNPAIQESTPIPPPGAGFPPFSAFTPTTPLVMGTTPDGIGEGLALRLFDDEKGLGLTISPPDPDFDVQSEGLSRTDPVLSLGHAGPPGGFVRITAIEAVLDATGQRWVHDAPLSGQVGQAVWGTDPEGLIGVVPLLDEEALLLYLFEDDIPITHRLSLRTYGEVLGGEAGAALAPLPLLVDVNQDQLLDVLCVYGSKVLAFSRNGALLSDFPIELAAPSVAQPLVARLTESGNWSVLIASTNGHVYAYDLGQRGALVPGFPLAVGRSIEATPLLHNRSLFAVSTDGSLRAWELDNLGAVWWGQRYGNPQNQSYVTLGEVAMPGPVDPAVGLIVEAETYNWPNPIRTGRTFLRCMTSEDATVKITIIDAAGGLVEEAELDVRGGAPAEHVWETTAESGLYFARITAVGRNGVTETTLIKMAVIR